MGWKEYRKQEWNETREKKNGMKDRISRRREEVKCTSSSQMPYRTRLGERLVVGLGIHGITHFSLEDSPLFGS